MQAAPQDPGNPLRKSTQPGDGSVVGGVQDPAQGQQPFADFGRAVGPAGDVNGDGYDDAIVGALPSLPLASILPSGENETVDTLLV